MEARSSSSLGDLFDPMSVLVEDAVSFEPPELVYDFIDRLLTSQPLPQLPDPPSPIGSSPIAIRPHERHGYSKRHKRIEQPRMLIGSPISTMDYANDFDFLPPVKHSSASGSDSERSPPRSHGGAGLSRKNRPQRCSICKETGHKSRTCRFAQGKVDLRPGSPPGFSAIALQTSSF